MRMLAIALVLISTPSHAQLQRVCIKWETWKYMDYTLIHPRIVTKKVCRQWKMYR